MSIKDDIEELKKIVKEDKEKGKKFRYPGGTKVTKAQRRKNYVTVFIPYENGTCDFKKYRIEDQTIWHDLIPRLATAGHVMHDKKGNPVIILPNWTVEPFSPMEHYEKSMVNGSNTVGYRLLMAAMQSEKVSAKKPMPPWLKWVGGAVLVGIIIFALLSGDGGA